MSNERNDKFMRILGIVATITAISMYVSYIPQIQNNLQGIKSSPIQPLVAMINCILWVAYGFMKEKKDWAVILANLPGVVFGFIAAMTAF